MNQSPTPNAGLALPEHIANQLEAAQAEASAQELHEKEMIAAARAMHFDLRSSIYASLVALESNGIKSLEDDELIKQCIELADEAAWRYIELGVPGLGIKRTKNVEPSDTELGD